MLFEPSSASNLSNHKPPLQEFQTPSLSFPVVDVVVEDDGASLSGFLTDGQLLSLPPPFFSFCSVPFEASLCFFRVFLVFGFLFSRLVGWLHVPPFLYLSLFRSYSSTISSPSLRTLKTEKGHQRHRKNRKKKRREIEERKKRKMSQQQLRDKVRDSSEHYSSSYVFEKSSDGDEEENGEKDKSPLDELRNLKSGTGEGTGYDLAELPDPNPDDGPDEDNLSQSFNSFEYSDKERHASFSVSEHEDPATALKKELDVLLSQTPNESLRKVLARMGGTNVSSTVVRLLQDELRLAAISREVLSSSTFVPLRESTDTPNRSVRDSSEIQRAGASMRVSFNYDESKQLPTTTESFNTWNAEFQVTLLFFSF